MYAQLFKFIRKELPIASKELWQTIIIPKYLIEKSILIKWLDKETEEAIIPEGISSIGDTAFFMNDKITTVNIPNGVTSIGAEAFWDCKNLSTINIPDGVTSIGYEAFWGCENLKSINIPNSVTYIGTDAFYGCKNIEFDYNLFKKPKKRKVDPRQMELWD